MRLWKYFIIGVASKTLYSFWGESDTAGWLCFAGIILLSSFLLYFDIKYWLAKRKAKKELRHAD